MPKKTKKPSDNGAVKEKFDDLVMKRRARRREDGDGQGCDVGMGIVGSRLEKILDNLNKPTKNKLLEHIRHHTDEAVRPILKIVEKAGDDTELKYLRSVAPNMLRTIMEFLEDESKN